MFSTLPTPPLPLYDRKPWGTFSTSISNESAALTETVQALNLGSVAPCGAGLYALLHVGGKTPARELAPLAEQAGVHLTRLSDYAVMQNDESRVVLLGFSGMDEDQIRQGLSALKKAWG